jgi:predicted benzoate:H+ symporter BenE
MKMSSIKPHIALIPVVISLGTMIMILTTSSKVPVRITLTTPYLKLMVEINTHQSPHNLNFLQDTKEILVAID